MIVADGIDVETGQKNTVAVPVRKYVQAYYDNDMIATFDASYAVSYTHLSLPMDAGAEG